MGTAPCGKAGGPPIVRRACRRGGMVDASDLKSVGRETSRAGSTPAVGTSSYSSYDNGSGWKFGNKNPASSRGFEFINAHPHFSP